MLSLSRMGLGATDLSSVLQRAATADRILSGIVDELRTNAGLLTFPDLDESHPEDTNANEWFEVERMFFDNERKAIEAAILATNPQLSPTTLRQFLQSKNAFADLQRSVDFYDPIPASVQADRIENLLRVYDELALGQKPRGKTNVGLIVGGVVAGLAVLGGIIYFTRKR